jgi:acid phosphatase (class A)
MPWITGAKVLLGVSAIAGIGLLVIMEGKPPEAWVGRETHPAELGYLSPTELPDSSKLLLPPPQLGSAASARDLQAREAALKLKGTSRYTLAADDANRAQPNTVAAFDCAFGASIDPKTLPTLYGLLGRVRLDVRAAAYAAKSRYKRPRPYVQYKATVCYPEDEKLTRADGSYPSARGAVGWAYALVLAELNPARSSQIMKRGDEFGQSRVVCDEEWLSDVDAGRTLAAAVIKQMQSKHAFQRDMQASRKEMDTLFARGAQSPANCPAEAKALAAR